ncbi:MAG: hypothetical protein EPO57_01950 [Chitinophagaceae bacterium]|nr:MAG: hypothetical protein EPO57_01950 [Chitinophagaceae bacterium]
MKNRLSVYIVALMLLVACSKDKFQTKPQLKFISVSKTVVVPGSTLQIKLQCTDKEGDVDDSLIVVRQRLNKRGAITLPPSPYKIPEFTNTSSIEFQLSLNYQFGLVFGIPPLRIPGTTFNEPDTLSLKFVARDKAGNKSDTLTVSNIFVIR